jgi:cellulose synthase/poly-beta-1,6-N-acetylglucosamine synthase-like glycosyltransferase
MLDLNVLNELEWLVVILYGALLLFIFLYSLTQVSLVISYLKNRKHQPTTPKMYTEWPHVTVQLPVFNERYVAERLIHAVTKLNYPAEKLEIQVLDDSTDDTLQITRKVAAEYRDKGLDVTVLHRTDRSGYKAGALAVGMEQAKGEFIAIFDADFIPDADFLIMTIPHFQTEKVGVVQTRWEHLNKDYSGLTRLQAFGLDAHFTVEQGGRNASGYFINFNGTAGVWRKQTIEDAGGWSSDTLTEDLDLSYRAQLKGWDFVYREDIGSPAELPAAMNALKNQQFRWTKGAAECTRKNLGKVWRAKHLPWSTKIHALFHLMNSFIFICVMGTAILSVPLLFIKEKLGQDSIMVAAGSVFLLSMCFLIWFYWVSYHRMHPKKNFLQFL